jgi:hypothetical protein
MPVLDYPLPQDKTPIPAAWLSNDPGYKRYVLAIAKLAQNAVADGRMPALSCGQGFSVNPPLGRLAA